MILHCKLCIIYFIQLKKKKKICLHQKWVPQMTVSCDRSVCTLPIGMELLSIRTELQSDKQNAIILMILKRQIVAQYKNIQ